MLRYGLDPDVVSVVIAVAYRFPKFKQMID